MIEKTSWTFILFASASIAAGQLSAQQPVPPAPPPSGWVGIMISGEGETDHNGKLAYDDYPVVVSVDPGSPAARAGLLAGDTIVAFNDYDPRKSPFPMRSMIQPGKIFFVRIKRAGTTKTARVRVVERTNDHPETLEIALKPTSPRISQPIGVHTRTQIFLAPTPAPSPVNGLVGVAVPGVGFVMGATRTAVAGAEVRRLSAEMGEALGVRSPGLFVVSVANGSPAEEWGFRDGDVLLRASNTSLLTPQDFIELIRSARDREVRVEIVRKRQAQAVVLKRMVELKE